jgi:peptidyl-prolyl cis-trans isomerase A (cyclophilin A)
MLKHLLIALVACLAMIAPAVASAQTDKGPDLDPAKEYYGRFITNKGEIFVKFFPKTAPETVKNFVNLAEGTRDFRDPKTGKWTKRPYFNGIQFHRVIPDFMVQTGDPTATGMGGPGYSFRDEFHPTTDFNKPGILGMANSGANTNGSQFFITEKPVEWLNNKHTVFGEILSGTDGLEVVKAIARVDRDGGDKPKSAVVIERIVIKRLAEGTTPADALAALKADGNVPAAVEAPATEAAPVDAPK